MIGRNCEHCGKLTKNPRFCDRSCAASFNNAKAPKRKPEHSCKGLRRTDHFWTTALPLVPGIGTGEGPAPASTPLPDLSARRHMRRGHGCSDFLDHGQYPSVFPSVARPILDPDLRPL